MLSGILLVGGVASASYILLFPYYAMPGEELSVMGNDFPSNESMSVSVGDQTLPPVATNQNGSFAAPKVKIPNTGGEPLAVRVQGVSGTESTSSVSVGGYHPFVAPNTYYLLPGGTLRFTGIRFAPNEEVLMTGNNTAAVARADGEGAFEIGPFAVGYVPANRVYRFTGTESRAFFDVTVHVGKVNPWLTLDTYYAPPGTPLSISGHFFGLNEPVSLFFQGVFLGTTITDGNGSFSLSTSVPLLNEGFKMISARGLTTGAEATSSFSEAGF